MVTCSPHHTLREGVGVAEGAVLDGWAGGAGAAVQEQQDQAQHHAQHRQQGHGEQQQVLVVKLCLVSVNSEYVA